MILQLGVFDDEDDEDEDIQPLENAKYFLITFSPSSVSIYVCMHINLFIYRILFTAKQKFSCSCDNC